jgi:hypothetical protein
MNLFDKTKRDRFKFNNQKIVDSAIMDLPK